jgi:hypothetical protein
MTPLPDPADDLVGFLRALGAEVRALRQEREERRIDACEASRLLGYKDKRYLCRAPWRIPDYGERGTMLALSQWREWNESPERARRAKWDAFTLAQRRALLGLEPN